MNTTTKKVDHIPPGTWLEIDPAKFNQIITKPIKKDNMNPINDRASCIAIVLSGTNEPVQTKTLEALERDRLRIAKLIAGEDKQLRQLIDSYTMASRGTT
jgi:hypothetical protein